VTDEMLARLRAHDNNIIRYRRLLETNLSELERGFIERRLTEEMSAVESLAHSASHPYELGPSASSTRVRFDNCSSRTPQAGLS
jgi:hypothetical protein